MLVMLSYDLNGGEKSSAYTEVTKMVEAEAVACIKPLYSQWFIETYDTVQEGHERMQRVADVNDHWFIVPIGRPRQGWMPKSVWDWIRARE